MGRDDVPWQEWSEGTSEQGRDLEKFCDASSVSDASQERSLSPKHTRSGVAQVVRLLASYCFAEEQAGGTRVRFTLLRLKSWL